MDLKKAGSKKQGNYYSKREEAAWPLLFLNNNDPVFSPSYFQVHILDLIFFRITNRPMFSKQEYWVQIDWATNKLLCPIFLFFLFFGLFRKFRL